MNYYFGSRFNQNEWFVIVLLTAYIVVFMLPKRFPLSITLMFIIYGISIGRLWDQIIGTPSMDFYDINDSNKIELFDILLYCSYGPFSYFMIYIFDYLKLKKQHLIFFMMVWGLIAVGVEWIGTLIGVFNYKNGYNLTFSFPAYLISYSILFILYYKLYKAAWCHPDDK